jgi:hypothetical protein
MIFYSTERNAGEERGKYPNDEERFLKTGKKRGKTREKARIWQDARLFEVTPESFRADPDEKCEIIQFFGGKRGIRE